MYNIDDINISRIIVYNDMATCSDVPIKHKSFELGQSISLVIIICIGFFLAGAVSICI